MAAFSYGHLDERTTARGVPSAGNRPVDTDPSTFFGDPDRSNADVDVDAFSLLLEHDFANGLNLKNRTRVTHYDKFYQNVFPSTGVAVSAAGNVTLSAYNNANDRTNIFNQTDLTTKFKTGGLEHTLLTGLELGHQDSTTKRNTGFFGAGAGTTSVTVPASNPVATATSFRQNGTDANNNGTCDVDEPADASAAEGEGAIVVTGSRIRRDQFNTADSVQIITRSESTQAKYSRANSQRLAVRS